MHKRELNIIVNKEDKAIKRGDFFEEIVSNIFKTQRYTIKERVNFTGMEIDLIAQHIDRKNEIVYIECKARQSLEAKDIKSFEIMLPPIELQNQFADFVTQVDKLKVEVQKSLDELQTLFNSLMQQYFG